jgi:hypothetical protein
MIKFTFSLVVNKHNSPPNGIFVYLIVTNKTSKKQFSGIKTKSY